MIKVKRIYEDPATTDGQRILVDRLWPRGIKKETAKIDLWAKDLTPPHELISWFHEDKDNRFKEFEKKYRTYLKDNKNKASDIIDKRKKITLVTAVKDRDHSHIPTLLKFLQSL